MNRLGFRHDNLGRTLPEVLASPNLRLEAVFTHFAVGRRAGESASSTRSATRFDAALPWRAGRTAARCGTRGNSAALLRDSRVWYDAVRPGLLLYGIVPPPLASTIRCAPVMSLTSRVTAVKGLRPGEGVGYGWRFRPTRRGRSPSCRPATPTASTRAWRPRLGADSRASRARRGRRVDGHDHGGRHRSRRRASPATKW